MLSRNAWGIAVAVVAGLLAACSDGGGGGGRRYDARIRWTSFGIPHVEARDLGSLAFGEAYAEARFNACIIADQIVRVRSERSRYFGPGEDDANLIQDLGLKAGRVYETAQEGYAELSDELREAITGYAAGYDQYLADVGSEGLPAPCAGAEWVKPITPEDLFSYYYLLALFASFERLIPFVATAAPPGMPAPLALPASARTFPDLRPRGLGSNGWALGRDGTESGHSMVLANPHFPWEGSLRFWEKHLTIPGELDVYGVSLVGVPVVNIGFNRHVAWTHTVTSAKHFTIYKLDLVPGDPTRYFYDGEERAMSSFEVTVDVRQPDGSVVPVTRTFWRSHYGPMLNLPVLGWTETQAFTMRDANERNFAVAAQWLEMDRARSMDDFVELNERVHGIPWVNTMAADDQGNALYIDASRTPNLSDEAIAAYLQALDDDPLTALVADNGAVLLDGSRSLFEWVDDGAAAPGIVSIPRSPMLRRSDYVANANDSYWLTNASAPLTGFSPLFGFERTPRSPRTRMNLMMLTERRPGGASGADGKFSFDELAAVEFNERASIAELLRDQVVARCTGAAPVALDGGEVDVGPACDALREWDGRLDLASRGALVWRELLGRFDDLLDAGDLFAVPFDPEDPIATPRDLAPPPAEGPDPVLVALGEATQTLEAAGFAVDATLGEAQFAPRGGRIPIPGGTNREGAFNIVGFGSGDTTLLPGTERGPTLSRTGLTADGYPVNNGSSFMMVAELTPDGPRARAVLSYSQSPTPGSEHFNDQTLLFSEERRRPCLFTEGEIRADPELREERVTGERPR